MNNENLSMMMRFTYKYLSIAIILLFACASFLVILSNNQFIWYAYAPTCILSGFILLKYANKIVVKEDALLIKGLYRNELLRINEIHKIGIFKDPFFYGKTLGVNIHLKNGSLKRIHIGTLSSSYLPELNKILNDKL